MYGTLLPEGYSIHIETFYKNEKLKLERKNGRSLYSQQDKEIEQEELCDLFHLLNGAEKEIKPLKRSDLDINSILNQY